jgi:hypothetical protein
MSELKRFSLVKPTPETPFHIDFAWWKQHDNNWRVHLHDCLCSEHQEVFSNLEDESWVDWIDPETAEVKRVDGLQHVLITHCARQTGFLTVNTTLVDAVFRTFLANGNVPMSPNGLAVQINRPADTILKTLAGPQVYKGLRPCQN